jgi:hypothetical protein
MEKVFIAIKKPENIPASVIIFGLKGAKAPELA